MFFWFVLLACCPKPALHPTGCQNCLGRCKGATSLLHGRIWKMGFHCLTHMGKSVKGDVMSQSSTYRLCGQRTLPWYCRKKMKVRVLPRNSSERSSACCCKGAWEVRVLPSGHSPHSHRRVESRGLPAGSATTAPIVWRENCAVFLACVHPQNRQVWLKSSCSVGPILSWCSG